MTESTKKSQGKQNIFFHSEQNALVGFKQTKKKTKTKRQKTPNNWNPTLFYFDLLSEGKNSIHNEFSAKNAS